MHTAPLVTYLPRLLLLKGVLGTGKVSCMLRLQVYIKHLTLHKISVFESLVRAGLSGTFLNALKVMYESVVSCVRVDNHSTEFFSCPFGLKQGCMFSTELFSMFINEITVELNNVGRHGIQLQPGILEILLLSLFADDLALLSSTATGHQNQLSRKCGKLQ